MKTLRLAILLQVIGLVLEAVSILKLGPITFIVFASLAVPCLAAGMLLYLYLLLRGITRAAGSAVGAPPAGGSAALPR